MKIALLLLVMTVAVSSGPIPLTAAGVAHTYTGHGGLSAGASSRLLMDYNVSVRSDILDMLFKPQWGLGLHILKVEIGGDDQSTDGSEPSHSHSRGDLSCTRGYELMLLKEAKARNPDILTYGLSWGAPGWVNNGTYFGVEMVAYQTEWVKCMRREGITMDYIGVWNERPWGGADYVKALRAALDEGGFSRTQIIIPDGGYDPAIMADAAADAAFRVSFSGLGLHYPCTAPHPEVQAGEKMYWASEDWSSTATWKGAADWGHLPTQNYVMNNMTTTIAWSPLWAVYKGSPFEPAGLFVANEPWSGHWEVSPPVWTGAQWSQFTRPGWRFLSVSSGGSGHLPGGGTYVSLVPPAGAVGLTVILETLQGTRCPNPTITASQTVVFAVSGGAPLPGPGTRLSVWATNATVGFQHLPDVVIGPDGSFAVTIGPDTIITLSTFVGATKGQPAVWPIPLSAPFPLPYSDDFSLASYPVDDVPGRFWADQFGSWAVRSGEFVQVTPLPVGANGWISDGDPVTILGDILWTDVTVAARVRSSLSDGAPAGLAPCDSHSPYQHWVNNSAGEGYLSNADPTGLQCLNVAGCGNRVVFWSCVTSGGTCCGPTCYKNLQWGLTAGGQLTTALPGAACLTAPSGGGLTTAPCVAGATNQRWTYDARTGLLELLGTGQCLAQPSPPPPNAQVCARVASFSGFSEQSVSGYCLRVQFKNATWQLLSSDGNTARPLASGTLPPSTTFLLNLTVVGTHVVAVIGGVTVAHVTDGAHTAGRVALGSSSDVTFFDDFSVGPA